ncbi:hypothetical protein, partial [Halococcus hamelinensis]|uniref:hypothetical protein n=1 Tax=Halococcus hamelinensis TaxID=332168 RepID=UPI001ED983CB
GWPKILWRDVRLDRPEPASPFDIDRVFAGRRDLVAVDSRREYASSGENRSDAVGVSAQVFHPQRRFDGMNGSIVFDRRKR